MNQNPISEQTEVITPKGAVYILVRKGMDISIYERGTQVGCMERYSKLSDLTPMSWFPQEIEAALGKN